MPFPISVNALYRHVATPNGGVRRAKSPKYDKWHRQACQEILTQRLAQPRLCAAAYSLTVELVKPHGEQRRDLDNLCKGVSDVLVSMGVVRDDSGAQEIHLRWMTGDVPKCIVTVEAVDLPS